MKRGGISWPAHAAPGCTGTWLCKPGLFGRFWSCSRCARCHPECPSVSQAAQHENAVGATLMRLTREGASALRQHPVNRISRRLA